MNKVPRMVSAQIDPIQAARDALAEVSGDPLLPAKAKRTMLQLSVALDLFAHRQNELAYMLLQLRASSSTYIDADLQAAWRDRLVAAGFPQVVP